MEGKDVDWFAAIKSPKGLDASEGKSFVYFDSSQTGFEWSPVLINSTDSAIGATINQLYGINKDITFSIAYNDDSPDGKVDGYRAHAKGVAVFDHEVGFWILHSVPNFPPSKKYDFHDGGSVFSQSFLCLSLSVNFLEDVGQYMRFAHVSTYLYNLPEFHKIVAPSLVDVVKKKSLPKSATVFTTIRELQTLNGTKAKGFSKHRKFEKDLWYSFIAPSLKTPMSVETWRSGSGTDVGSQCSKNKMRYNVYDVEVVKLLGKTFANGKDHSKWGVSMDKNVPAVCIGDVNRQESQFHRGGGAVCIQDIKLWQAFRGSVGKYAKCRTKPRTPRNFEEDATKRPEQSNNLN
ncbi:deoxyribonuclease II [Ancylostoma ceylanicum]|nr:deoxyribonuclease II [Ancylostoma ceylanicum]EYC17207.1 hypothetical protein Y032_0031g2338 [Ancylostoma ceylanicum]